MRYNLVLIIYKLKWFLIFFFQDQKHDVSRFVRILRRLFFSSDSQLTLVEQHIPFLWCTLFFCLDVFWSFKSSAFDFEMRSNSKIFSELCQMGFAIKACLLREFKYKKMLGRTQIYVLWSVANVGNGRVVIVLISFVYLMWRDACDDFIVLCWI